MTKEPEVQEFGDFDIDDIDEIDAEMKGDSKFMKLEVGKNWIRLLPPPKGVVDANGKPAKVVTVVYEHWIKLDGMERSVKFACPRNHEKLSCPACEEADRMARSGNRVDRDGAKNYYPQRRIYANVIDRKNEGLGPRILALPKGVWDSIKEYRRDDTTGGNPAAPEGGNDILITRVGTTKDNTKYTVRILPTEKSGDFNPAWAGMLHNLLGLKQIRTSNQIKAMLRGEDPEDAEEDNDLPPSRQIAGKAAAPAVKPQAAAGTTASKKQRTAEDVMDEVIDGTTEEDEDVPASRRRK